MNKLLKLSAFLMIFFLSACSTDDEPEPEYTGPWSIAYYEEFYMMHTNNSDFPSWFNTHTEDFVEGRIERYNGAMDIFYKLAPNETYDTFKECYEKKSGQLMWIEIVEHATEAEMQKMKDDFEKFSTEYKPNKYYDLFEANFQKYEPSKK